MTKVPQWIVGIGFIVAGIVWALFLFWDGVFDIIDVIKATETDRPVLVWALIRVMGGAELVCAIGIGIGIRILTAGGGSRYSPSRSGKSNREVEYEWHLRNLCNCDESSTGHHDPTCPVVANAYRSLRPR